MNNYFIILKKWSLLFILAFLLFLFFFLDLNRYLSFNTFEQYQLSLQTWTTLHYNIAVGFYIIIFIGAVACAIPAGLVLTFIGGFLFGMIAIIYSLLGTTVGGLILFFAVRTSLGAHIKVKSQGWIKKLEHGFQRNAFSYLLMLRLIPIFPCWISNIAAGALNVPLKTFINASILGVLPATFILVAMGNHLDHFLLKHIHHYSQNVRISR